MKVRPILLPLGVVVGSILLLKACVPQLWGPQLPGDVIREISEEHTVCIGVDDVPIWPGDYRQAQCGNVQVEIVAGGVVPSAQKAEGITQAVCYRLTVENPYWETQAQTRHEILTQSRISHKVAVLQAGEWLTFRDEDVEDRSRWELYGCPAPPG
jgi:hypothetical protein